MKSDCRNTTPISGRLFGNDATLRDAVLSLAEAGQCCVDGGDTILEALAAMEEGGASALVVSADSCIAGILTAGDCAFRLLLEGRDPGKTRCREIMRKNPFVADANMPADQCLDHMLSKRFEHAVVSFGGYPVGCVSAVALLKFLLHGGSCQGKQQAQAAAHVPDL